MFPAALVVGLLTFPTICSCGGQTPHSHALFLLSHHDHHAEASTAERQDRDAHHEHNDDEPMKQSVAARRSTASAQRVSVQAPAPEGGLGTPLSVMTPYMQAFGTASGPASPYRIVRIAVGVHLMPDTPPPRLRLAYAI